MDATLLTGETAKGLNFKRSTTALLTVALITTGAFVFMLAPARTSRVNTISELVRFTGSPLQLGNLRTPPNSMSAYHSNVGSAFPLRLPERHQDASRCARERGLWVIAEATKRVYVAGGTGRTGMRVARQCRNAGFEVVLGARSEEKTRRLAEEFGIDAYEYATLDAMNVKPIDLRDADAVAVCLGASETEFNPSGPRTIDNELSRRVFQAAAKAGNIEHVVMVSSLGTAKFGLPAAVLNLFFGVLDQKRTAELALKSSGLKYTIVRPGGMERPGDDYKNEYGTKVYEPNTQFSGQVSRLQVAEVCAEILSDPSCACNKVIELVADGDPQNVNLRSQLEAVKGIEEGAQATSTGPR